MLSEFEKQKSDKKKKKAKSRKPGGGGGGVAGKKKKRSPKVGDKSPSGNLIDALNNLEIGNQRSLLTTTTTLTNEINLSSNQNESDPTVENNELHQWPPKPNDSLRWEYELTDEQAEQARLEIYKQNRRKRYVEHRARMCRVKFDLYEDEDEDDDELDNEEDDLDVESSSLGPGSRLAKNTSRLFRKKKSTSEVFTTTSNLNEKTRPTGMNNRGNDDSAISSLSSSNSPFL